jgi:phage regulator Rha-like protein
MGSCRSFHAFTVKMNYNKIAELIPKTVGTRHSHNTRQINNIVNINCRTSLYSEYFLHITLAYFIKGLIKEI